MSGFEYKVVPSPAKAEKIKGVSAPDMRFALSVEGVINRYAAEGWEYLRADSLPSEERQGLRGRKTEWRTLLVFRRPAAARAALTGTPDWAAADRPALQPVAAGAQGAADHPPEDPIAVPGVLRADKSATAERGVADKPAGMRLWAVRRSDETR